jgi:hypothetical protein
MPRVDQDEAGGQIRPAERQQLDQDAAPAVPGQHAWSRRQAGNHRCQVIDPATRTCGASSGMTRCQDAAPLLSPAQARRPSRRRRPPPAARPISAVTVGITVCRHLIKVDELATADPAHVIALLRPCVLSLTAPG